MEYLAFKQSMESLHKSNVDVTAFVSDRHSSIAKHMREQLPEIIHYFDLWHLTKNMYKNKLQCCIDTFGLYVQYTV